jgi:peptidoglycan/LPS O-acetylase OafA/YrhL
MISGFTIVKSARHKTVSEFLAARIVRLYPVYWLSCILTFIGLRVSHLMGDVSVKQFLFNMTMLQEFFGQASINGVYWTLTYELTFYFLVTLLISYRLWDYLLPVVVGWLGYTLVAGPEPGASTLFTGLFIPRYSPYFIAGLLFYLLQTRTVASWKVYAALAATVVLTLRTDRAARHAAEQFYHAPHLFNPIISLVLILSLFVLFHLIIFRRFTLPPSPLWAWLGKLTYPLYLTHMLGAIPLQLLNGRVDKHVLLGATIALVLAVAWLVHILVEVPGTALLTRKLMPLLTASGKLPVSSPADFGSAPATNRLHPPVLMNKSE